MAAKTTTRKSQTTNTEAPNVSTNTIGLGDIATAMLELKRMISAQNEEIAKLKSARNEPKESPAAVVEQPSVAQVSSNGVVKLVANPTDKDLRDFANAENLAVNARGAIAATHPVRAQYAAAYKSSNGKVSTASKANTTRGSESGNWWEQSEPKFSESSYVRQPSRKEAGDMYVRHPEHDAVEKLTGMDSSVLANMARAGKPNAAPALRSAPINGNARRCIMLLSRGVDSANVRLVVADAIAIMRDAGIALPV